MRLAEDEITIRVGRDTVYLRPTLRAALRLERRFGFPKLLSAIADGHVGIMAEIIREGSAYTTDIPNMLDAIVTNGVQISLEILTLPLFSFVASLVGADESDAGEAETGPRVTFAEGHEHLFRIATGWLGWTPDTAWNATRAEILAAHKGRVEMLQAIYGAPEKPAGSPATADERLKGALDAIGARVGVRIVKPETQSTLERNPQ